VTVPPGVDQGTQIRVVGEGEPGEQGGPPGNLYVVLEVEQHPIFQRRGDDILLELQINVAQAALGAELKVPGLEGDQTVTVEGGAQSGDIVRLKGKGVPRLKRSGRGDQIVMLRVSVPRRLSREQRRLFQELGETLEPETVWREKQSFVDDLREFLGL
jgi:molecular chaperone DnaJ